MKRTLKIAKSVWKNTPIFLIPYNSETKLIYASSTDGCILGRKHLYITSEDKIKEDDIVLCVAATKPYIFKCGGESERGYRMAGYTNGYTHSKKDYKKVIATTDISLGIDKIPDSVISVFIEKYNQNIITKILDNFELENGNIEIPTIEAPKYKVGDHILNEYELRQLQVDVKKMGIEGIQVTCLTHNTIHTLNKYGKFDVTPKPYSLNYDIVKKLFEND